MPTPRDGWRVYTGAGEGLLIRARDPDRGGSPTIRRFRRTDDGEQLGIPTELAGESVDLIRLANILRVAVDLRATSET